MLPSMYPSHLLWLASIPSMHLVAEDRGDVRQEANALQQVAGHHRQHDVEVELAPLPTDGDGRAVAGHLSADLDHRLADDRIDLAGHDRAARLDRGQDQLAQAGLRPGAHQTDVVGDLHQRSGQRRQRAGGEDVGIARALSLEVVGGLAELGAGQRR